MTREPRNLLRYLVAPIAAVVVVLTVSASSPIAGAAPGGLHIHELRGSVVRFGTYEGHGLLGVRLHATVCVESPKAALAAYPSAIGVTHFAVSRNPTRWWPARQVTDRAPWLVPMGEGWNGKACGPVWVDDAIPPTHYGAESLGNPNVCYGVELRLRVGRAQATKRAIVRCPFGG